MKKILFLALSLALIGALTACGCQADMGTDNSPSGNVTPGTTVGTIPTMDTNIPDDDVNNNSTQHSPATEGTDENRSMH